MGETLCIYHGNCIDGLMAAAVVKRFIPDAAFHAGTHGDPPPLDLARGKAVYVVDFSYKRGPMMELIHVAARTIVLDHHKTAWAELNGIQHDGRCGGNTLVIFDMDRSGAGLAWDHFSGAGWAVVPTSDDLPRPRLINHVEDRDLWQFALPGTKEINHVLQCLPQTVEAFADVLDRTIKDGVTGMIQQGAVIGRYVDAKVAEVKDRAFEVTIAGHFVPAVNCPVFLASEVAGQLSEGRPFAASFVCSDREEFWSLRSRDGGIDVSEVAKSFGGGGHRNAAGFRCPLGTVLGGQNP